MKKLMQILAVLLTIVSLPTHAALKGSSTSWETEASVDEFTDKKKTFSMIAAEGGLDKGFIMIGCYSSGGFEGKVGAGQYIGDKDISENVKFRVDKNEPVTLTMNPTSKTYVYFNDMDSPFIKQLISGKESVVVQLTSYDYDTSKAKFSLKGAATAINKVLDACKAK